MEPTNQPAERASQIEEETQETKDLLCCVCLLL
jgi:hypothetical protein